MAVLPVLSLLCAMCALSLATELKVEEKRAVCSDGWSATGNHCFKYFPNTKTWSEAEGECVKQGGHLASIHNQAEAAFVGRLSGGTAWTWIGGGGDSESFRWYWTDGSAFDYSNWRQWEPNNYGGNEHCIQTNFYESGVWNDLPCHQQRPFVCAK